MLAVLYRFRVKACRTVWLMRLCPSGLAATALHRGLQSKECWLLHRQNNIFWWGQCGPAFFLTGKTRLVSAGSDTHVAPFKKKRNGLTFQPCQIYCQEALLQQRNNLLNEIILTLCLWRVVWGCPAGVPVEKKWKIWKLIYMWHNRCFLLYTL